MATEESKASDGAKRRYLVEIGSTAAESGGSFRACSQMFLQAIVDRLLKLRADWITARITNNDKFERLLAVIGDEIDRLDKNPELFPSEELRQNFFRFVHQIFQGWNAAFTELKTEGMEHMYLIADAVIDEEEVTRFAYTAGRKPWQQFLHNRAPGSGVHAYQMNPGGSTQVIPMGLSKLLRSWRNESEKVSEKIITEPKGVPQIAGGSFVTPEHDQRYRTTRFILGPQPIIDYTDHAPRKREGVDGLTKLTTLNLDFWDFEAEEDEEREANSRIYAAVHETAGH